MSNYWKETGAPTPNVSTAAADAAFLVPTNKSLVRRMTTAAGWAWVLAGFTVANLLLAHLRAPIRSPLNLFITELVFEIGRAAGSFVSGLSLVFAAFAIGLFVFLGSRMRAFRSWAFLAAICLVGIDAGTIFFLTTLSGLWPFLLHGLVIYFLILGLNAAHLHADRKKRGLA